MKKGVLLSIITIGTSILSFAQNLRSFHIHFQPIFHHQPVNLSQGSFQSTSSDSIQITVFKFYISNIQLQQDKQTVFMQPNSYHLINAAQEKSQQINMEIPNDLAFNNISFNLGIDSSINVSGALGGDLDPTKGMYWTWQSGYINLKLEGTSPLCNTRHHQFEFHVGGYHAPNNALQTITLPVNSKNLAAIIINLSQFFDSINLASQHHIMTPSQDAVMLAEKLSNTFSIKN